MSSNYTTYQFDIIGGDGKTVRSRVEVDTKSRQEAERLIVRYVLDEDSAVEFVSEEPTSQPRPNLVRDRR